MPLHATSVENLGTKFLTRVSSQLKRKLVSLLRLLHQTIIIISQLNAFLGMLNYYAKTLPNISSRLAPL